MDGSLRDAALSHEDLHGYANDFSSSVREACVEFTFCMEENLAWRTNRESNSSLEPYMEFKPEATKAIELKYRQCLKTLNPLIEEHGIIQCSHPTGAHRVEPCIKIKSLDDGVLRFCPDAGVFLQWWGSDDESRLELRAYMCRPGGLGTRYKVIRTETLEGRVKWIYMTGVGAGKLAEACKEARRTLQHAMGKFLKLQYACQHVDQVECLAVHGLHAFERFTESDGTVHYVCSRCQYITQNNLESPRPRDNKGPYSLELADFTRNR